MASTLGFSKPEGLGSGGASFLSPTNCESQAIAAHRCPSCSTKGIKVTLYSPWLNIKPRYITKLREITLAFDLLAVVTWLRLISTMKLINCFPARSNVGRLC